MTTDGTDTGELQRLPKRFEPPRDLRSGKVTLPRLLSKSSVGGFEPDLLAVFECWSRAPFGINQRLEERLGLGVYGVEDDAVHSAGEEDAVLIADAFGRVTVHASKGVVVRSANVDCHLAVASDEVAAEEDSDVGELETLGGEDRAHLLGA
ncbi:hypothetical protein PQI65_04510 [Brachybacterium paraconglomeratum]